MRQGVISQPNRLGNYQADALATGGALLHAVPSEVIKALKAQELLARSVQALMLDIVEARNDRNAKGIGTEV